MTKKTLLALWCVLVLAFVTASSLCAYAQAQNLVTQKINAAIHTPVQPTQRITQAIDEHAYVPLPGNTRPEATNAVNYRGPLEATFPVDHILLFLQRSPQQEQALDKLIEQLNDRKSPQFHKWLTAKQFGERYGVADEDIQQVTNWLQSQGFVINRVYPNKMLIDFSGTAGQIAKAFRTQMVRLGVKGEAHIANSSDPQIPAALAPVIKGIFSLNNFPPEAMHKSVTQYTFAGCTTTTDAPTEPGTCYAMTPQDNQTIYNLNPLYGAGISGQNQTIYLVEDTDSYGTDFNTYRTTFGLASAYPAGNLVTTHPGCTDPGTNGDDGEADIDVEVATAIAPSANINLISCASGGVTFGGLLALQGLLNESSPTVGVVSMSYGLCEAVTGNGANAAFASTFQQAATMGFSAFVSSGDGGSSGCSDLFGEDYDVTSLGITGWGSSPYNVSVGGTDFEDVYNSKSGQNGGNPLSTYWSSTNSSEYGSAKTYVPEIPWNDSCASVLISEIAHSSFTTYGSTGTCNTSPWDTSSGYLSAAAAAGGASNCATGAGGSTTTSALASVPECQGWAKPSYQTGAALTGGNAVYGMAQDGVRDIPDVAMFAANGVWGHYEIVCWSDPAYTSAGAATCGSTPSAWSGFGGTSVATPSMAAIQALINQETGEKWGNPNPYYYQIAQNEYGTAGGTFNGTSCNSSGTGGPAAGCAFNDVTQGDIDKACEDDGTAVLHHCYKPSGTFGVDSTDNVTGATVINGGTGYTTAPTCAIAAPSNSNPYKSPTGGTLWAGGTQATCTAAVTATSTEAVWTVAIACSSSTYPCATYVDGQEIVLTTNSGTTLCGPYTLSGSSSTAIATALTTSLGACTSVTAARSSSTVTITSKTTGYAGNFITGFYGNDYFGPVTVTITNTTKGQGPNYVSGITIGTAGSGYAPETPITLTSGVGSGAIAVANTTPTTAPTTYQPAYGAAPGYDLATGLGSPNATSLVSSCLWYPSATQGINTPVSGSTLGGDSAVFQWGPYPSATNYWVDIGSTYGGNNYTQSGPLGANACSLTVNSRLPTDGSTVYVTWWYYVGGSWAYTEYTYIAYGGSSQIGVITAPPPTSTLTGSSVTFTWNRGTLSTAYWIDAGSSPEGNQYFQSGNLGNVTSKTVNGLPLNGSTVYITLWSLVDGQWLYNEYTYTALNPSSCLSTITSPTPGSTLTAYSDTFGWTASTNPGCSGAVTNYWVDAGTTTTENFYLQSGPLGLVFSYTTGNDLPPGYGYGQPPPNDEVQMTLWNFIGGSWVSSPEVGYCGYGFSGYPACNTPTDGAGDPAPLRKMVKR
jgi:hypothetical protein